MERLRVPVQSFSQVLHADLAPADARPKLTRFEGLRRWISVKRLIYGGQPEAVFVSKVVACAFGPIALYEG